jgi:hypothetical protein
MQQIASIRSRVWFSIAFKKASNRGSHRGRGRNRADHDVCGDDMQPMEVRTCPLYLKEKWLW